MFKTKSEKRFKSYSNDGQFDINQDGYGVYVHRVVALVGIISTLRLSICLVDLPHLDKLMTRCRVKMTQSDILSF